MSWPKEIQELRHKSQSSGDAANASSVIDQSLSQLDERLETVAQGIKSIDESLEPLLRRSDEAYEVASEERAEHAMILRKHAAVVAEWDASQKDIQVLREELKEDKWLTVFRTVTEQADGMMTSLEKAVNRCQVGTNLIALTKAHVDNTVLQDFIFQMQRRGNDDAASFSSSTSSLRSDQPTRHQEMFTSLLESYEAKKKYVPELSLLCLFDLIISDTTCPLLRKFSQSLTKVFRIVLRRTVNVCGAMPILQSVGGT